MTLRSDDLAARIVQRTLADLPGLDIDEIGDLILGTAQPAGEADFNLSRAVTVILGHDWLPGNTVNRYCASSPQAARMAFHSVAVARPTLGSPAGWRRPGFDRGAANSWPDTQNPVCDAAQERGAAQAEQGTEGWADPREKCWYPKLYIAMGLTAENVARHSGVTLADGIEVALDDRPRRERG